MELSAEVTLEISESQLIDWLHSTQSTKSLDELMEWLATSEGDAALCDWIDEHSGISFDGIDDSSYDKLINYIEDNF